MTTTEPVLDDERARRLARLRDRRGQDAPSDDPRPSAPLTAELPPVTPTAPAAPARHRRSPATNARIITVGASATAMLGMVAGYGIADGLTSDGAQAISPDIASAPLPTATPSEIPPASSTATPAGATSPSRPQVIVVVVDGATGETLSTKDGTGDLAADLAAAGVTSAGQPPVPAAETPSAPDATPTETPAMTAPPVAAPAAVDLAVPVPPPPPPQPAAQAAPAAQASPAPQTQATSSGS